MSQGGMAASRLHEGNGFSSPKDGSGLCPGRFLRTVPCSAGDVSQDRRGSEQLGSGCRKAAPELIELPGPSVLQAGREKHHENIFFWVYPDRGAGVAGMSERRLGNSVPPRGGIG